MPGRPSMTKNELTPPRIFLVNTSRGVDFLRPANIVHASDIMMGYVDSCFKHVANGTTTFVSCLSSGRNLLDSSFSNDKKEQCLNV